VVGALFQTVDDDAVLRYLRPAVHSA
jgi:hypothetical protein